MEVMENHIRRRGGVERAYGISDEDRHINIQTYRRFERTNETKGVVVVRSKVR
jgi:hypothetical protein